ncbi:MAG: long-chain fatty acid--CoA ligase [Sandaracinaceae bacterium]
MFDLGPPVQVRPTSSAARTVGEMFWLRAARSASSPAIHYKDGGAWKTLSWSDLYDQAARVAGGLRRLGVRPGERVAILGPTQPSWARFDLGAQLAGCVSLGIYPKQSKEQVHYLLEHSEARVVFVSGKQELETVRAARDGLNVHVVPWEDALAAPDLESPGTFEGQPLAEADIRAGFERPGASEETAIFIYTSGTTGPPKGAMIRHRNILSLLTAAQEASPYSLSDLSLHFLPMAHAAERVLGFYGRVNAGIPGAYAESTGTVLRDLSEVRPTLFGSVPRIFEKAYAKIHSELEKKPPAVRKLFAWADGIGRQRAKYLMRGRAVPAGLAVQYAVAERLVFKKIRDAFGGRVRFMIAGAAPTAPEILEFFWSVGLPIYEVYGMTESTVVTHVNRPGAVRIGTVGQVISPSECRIAEDGEILVRGPWVFEGYYKNPDATASTVVDGWLHTGDIGSIDKAGFLRITDRKKHLIITAGGKNLAPANIERAIKGEDPLISQVHAHGDRRPYISAILTPSPLETLEWGLDRGLTTRGAINRFTEELMANPAGRSPELNAVTQTIVREPEYQARITDAVRRGNVHLARVEQVRRFILLERDFSLDEDELTPTLKLKRRVIEEKHASVIERIYTDEAFALQP